MTETLSPKAQTLKAQTLEAKTWLTCFLAKMDAGERELRAEISERAARPPRVRRQPSAARLRRRRGPKDAARQAREDRAFERLAAEKIAAIQTFREAALKIALAAS